MTGSAAVLDRPRTRRTPGWGRAVGLLVRGGEEPAAPWYWRKPKARTVRWYIPKTPKLGRSWLVIACVEFDDDGRIESQHNLVAPIRFGEGDTLVVKFAMNGDWED